MNDANQTHSHDSSSMSPPPSRTLRQLFLEAADIEDAGSRADFIARACGDEVVLKKRLEELLAADKAAGPTPARPKAAPASEGPGTVIGDYKLLEKLGEGGCGIVYMAEQQEPVRRKVALKIIKLGMDTRSVIARFEAERQALALMDHPSIAKVLEAGATDTGRPYFVMELVGGIKITDYCEQNHLDTRQRLDLFMQVCRAIQHAHQKGIIHRDIKPSNVLVATQDGVPVPKVIDFGIAKATQGKLTDQTVFTAFEQFLGTPAYMSPEQAQVGGLDVDTRSDIYSLGVLLYELLTGRTPFDAKELLAVGLEAMRRTICEKEPPTPSTRLKLDVAAQQAQGPSGPKIKNQKSKIANDLDWIVMKCLEKDRARRYETANGLAMDILRHLNNEPVVAGPPSRVYRLRKLVRRNKLACTAAGAVTAALVIGLAVSMWLLSREKRALHRATAAEVKSDQVARFLTKMLEGVGPSKARGRDTAMLKEILDKTANQVARELTNQPQVELELLAILAEAYRDLGSYTQMEAIAWRRVDLAERCPTGGDLERAGALYQLGQAQFLLCKYGQAEQTERHALSIREKCLGSDHPDVARTLNAFGMALQGQLKSSEAEAVYRKVIATQRKRLGGEDLELAATLHNLGTVLDERRLAEAETTHREVLAIRRKLLGSENLDVPLSLVALAKNLTRQGRQLSEAEALCREALRTQRSLLGNEHPNVVQSLGTLAFNLRVQGRLAEAETSFREVLAMQRKLLGNENGEVAYELNELAIVVDRLGKPAEAEGIYREALTMYQKVLGSENQAVATELSSLGLVLSKQNKLGEAEAMQREALALRRRLLGEEHVEVANSLHNLADVLDREGKVAESEGMHRAALAMIRKLLGNHHLYVAYTMNSLARVLEQEDKLTEAEALRRADLAIRQNLLGEEHPEVLEASSALVSVLAQEGKFAEAEPIARNCLAISRRSLPDDWHTFNTESRLGACLLGLSKYAEAEPLLLAGYERMNEREAKIPTEGKPRIREALQRLVQLYDATGETNQASEWKKRLEGFDQALTKNSRTEQQPKQHPP
jgi:serine/threonine protein kinase/tetratricopeptide (TPR) repeat protein